MQWSLKALISHLLTFQGATLAYPFGPEAAVLKVKGKMFALILGEELPLRINLKCDPDDATALRSMFVAIAPGYHMNKEHWNTVTLDGTLDAELEKSMMVDSYALVVKGLKKMDRAELSNKSG